MNVQLPIQMDKSAFLTWVQGREERYELVDGRVIMMTGASRNHGRIIRNVLALLSAQLDPQWEPIAEFGLDAGPRTLRYPDIVVDRASAGGEDYRAIEPILLVEVLSPTSETIDLGDKAAEYVHMPTLHGYIVLAQNEHKAWVWLRGRANMLEGPTVISGPDQRLTILGLTLELPFSAIYRGVLAG
jgi:Uma2 family endonuclease